jgi:HEXXH motif-containing protein
VAAAAALRAGLPDRAAAVVADIRRPTHVPTMGLLVDDGIDSLAANRLLVVVAGSGTARLEVTIDDIDPWRDCHSRPVAARLSVSARAEWSALIDEAWTLLTAHGPHHAGEVASIVTSVVPLRPDPAYSNVSATNGDAFGGFAADFVPDAAGFAATLVHEATHSKVNALHDIDPLYQDDGTARYFAPWRPDPRPLAGVIHGLAAFTAVADVWGRLRAVSGLEQRATRQVAILRVQLERALDEIRDVPNLTAAGRRLVDATSDSVERLMDEHLPRADQLVANRSLAAAEAKWRATQ